MEDDLLTRFWTDLVGRLTGPMTFRLILQPLMAILIAVRDGVKDAREDRPRQPDRASLDPAQARGGPLKDR
jgi:hypothetical protein